MRPLTFFSPISIIFGLLILSSSQAIGKEKILVASDCFMSECFNESLISIKKENSGLVTVLTKFYLSNNPPSKRTYKVQCRTPGGYVEPTSPGEPNFGKRIPEPEKNPPHSTRAYKQFWVTICSRLNQ